ncbi:MAG: ATP-binding cassette domain-containing protein [Planctomycetota bacterium]|nr:ATP-binding cassette domain-containing protein [Planctomycetaceae bacterium]MDQ3332202.1 ATP-binding cassette domain-containing protein [Planctomycetota bacterium]
MALLSLEDVTFGHGGPLLMEHISFSVERGERIALLGRNGVGKSTLLKLLNGEVAPDGGEVKIQKGAKIARLIQEVPSGEAGSVRDVVAGGAPKDDAEPETHWQIDQQADRVMSKMSLDPQAAFDSLSSGLKRRVLLARTLVSDPDILLLDEPTNHLDIESITWLEGFLGRFPGTLIFVTHDRVFMRKLANRLIELERGRLFDWTCDYDTFLKRKEAALEAEAQQQAQFDKKLAQEEVWIRQGVKARRTRNEGRVRALEELRRQHQARRKATGTAKVQVQEAEKSGRLVVQAKRVNFSYGDRPIVMDLDVTLMRGDKIGVLGPNGCGKTTLLRLLLGDLKPSSGTVRHGTNLEVAYFDQLRETIEEEKTVQDNVSGGAEHVLVGGNRRHIIGYLQDFLFTPERSRSPARYLSGGERNRLLLAKLFTRPSNVLVLDEPTNDLDTETLELLENLLVEYNGSVLLVSHDRAFLDNVATSVLAFEGEGAFKEYEGGYDDWLRAKRDAPASATLPASPIAEPAKTASKPKKLNFKEQRELEALPERIQKLEAEQKELHDAMSDPAFFRQDGTAIAAATARLETLDEDLAKAYARWEDLELVANESA